MKLLAGHLNCGLHYPNHEGCKGTKFIVRGFRENDYCVDGQRVRMADDGSFPRGVTAAQREAIALFELEVYAEYLEWRSTLGELNTVEHVSWYQGPSLKGGA